MSPPNHFQITSFSNVLPCHFNSRIYIRSNQLHETLMNKSSMNVPYSHLTKVESKHIDLPYNMSSVISIQTSNHVLCTFPPLNIWTVILCMDTKLPICLPVSPRMWVLSNHWGSLWILRRKYFLLPGGPICK